MLLYKIISDFKRLQRHYQGVNCLISKAKTLYFFAQCLRPSCKFYPMESKLLHEIIPLAQEDCYTVFTRVKRLFDFPIHYHEEFELNFILDGEGTERVVGNHVGTAGKIELALIGPNLEHAWFNQGAANQVITEVSIQFHRGLLDEKFLHRNQLSNIRSMFDKAKLGILFGNETAEQLQSRLLNFHTKHGFYGVIELLSILNELSRCNSMQLLSNSSKELANQPKFNSRRIQDAIEHMRSNFQRLVSLNEVAEKANMTPTAFSRYFKNYTGINFVESLNNFRLGQACKLLIDTNKSVAEIAYECGFNNISNFNRIFKRKKGLTPKAFREEYVAGTRVFV